MSKVKDGGIVTAYGAAVRGGYTGTYQQFCAALGQLTEVLEEFEGFSVEVTTLNPGAPATADYNNGVLTLGIPRGETGNGIQSAVLNSDYTLTLTWTNGQHTTVGPIRGAVGATPNLTIGNVQTLQPSQPATATITGTHEDPVLNFGIPKGDPGTNGVSPAVTITEITDGHRVTITDGDHPQGQSFDVMDGQDGASDAGDVTYDETATYQSGTVGAELSSQKNAIDQLEDQVGTVTLMEWAHSADGYYVKTDVAAIDINSPYTYSASYTTGKASFIACNPGDVFIISLMAATKYRPYVICASDGTIIEGGDPAPYQYHDYQLIIPDNGAYVGFNSVKEDLYRTVYIDDSKFTKIDLRLDNLESHLISAYQGLSCVAFGTSLTYNNVGYRPYLAEMLGMTIDNQGAGSARWQWWQQDSSNVLYNVTHYEGYNDKDVCIIEGCVNDWGGSRTIGTYDDTTTDTVCGCLYNMINHVYTQNPNIQIIVILDHFGKVYGNNNCSSAVTNENGKTQLDYYEECAKLCEFYGIPCIKEYALSSIGDFGQQYLADQIHCSALGAKQSAQTIASAMANIKPKQISTP